ncbi:MULTISPECIES: hypothetical protein [Nocardia]|uniref:hypothetical protein n=1 Tax=Nocardia TaxID=1817 RepID=UPI002457944A|nr:MULTISPECIES: hypothetical protein [Nocardia]
MTDSRTPLPHPELPDTEQSEVQRLSQLAESLAIDSEDLDDYVHDAISLTASDINNSGLAKQVHALIEHLGPRETEGIIRAAAAEDQISSHPT